MLALNKSLLNKFIEIFIKKDPFVLDETTSKLIKYLQLPVAVSTHQNHLFAQPQIASQQGNLFKIHKKKTDDELVASTALKLMLVDTFASTSFITVNITDHLEMLDIRYSATYRSGRSREKAKQHIKALLEDAHYITIIDQFITSSAWNTNKKILFDICPDKSVDIKLYSEPQITQDQKNELTTHCYGWNISGGRFDRSRIHDRYIDTDKFEILLSSGLLYLQEDSKDFTYTVKLK
jgi:hypothetical protein